MSYIEISSDSDFTLANLPYGIFSTSTSSVHRIGVAVGKYVLDLSSIAHLFDGPLMKEEQHVFKASTLNAFMGLTFGHWQETRAKLISLLDAENPTLRDSPLRQKVFVNQDDVQMHMPVTVGDYTDFYSSIHHATNVGTMFRSKENPLLPNWRHLPVAYHGRASSVVVSGTPVRRPYGQMCTEGQDEPTFGPSKLLDFELEVAFFVGGPENQLGDDVISIQDAHRRIFGFVLMNDWSARDIQKWEYVPLGPFLAKNFATSISPWIVPLEALMPSVVGNPVQDPTPLPYLRQTLPFTFDVELTVAIKTAKGNEKVVSRSNMRHLYWTAIQQLTHHAVSGCNMRPGDLLGSGTISGQDASSYGCLLELTWRGSKPIVIGDEERKFLSDGDTVIMEGGFVSKTGRVGFGQCTGTVMPASTR